MKKDDDEKYITEETTYIPPSKEEARWIFDYNFFLINLRAKLRGEIIEQQGQKLIFKKISEPLLNEKGVEQTIAIVNGFVDKIHALSIINEERIMELCKDLSIKLFLFYYNKMDEFGITPEKASIVVRMIMDLFEMNLRKSIGGRGLMIIGQTERVSIVENEKEKKKFLGVI